MEKFELILHGRVQGVGCRQYCALVAQHYNVSGAVTNLTNGTVQLLLKTDKQTALLIKETLQDNKLNIRFWGKIDYIDFTKYEQLVNGDYCW